MRYLELKEFSEGDTIDIDASFFEANGAPMNLTGATIEWAIANSDDDPPPPVFVATSGAGGGITVVGSPTLGTAKIEIHVGHTGRSAVIPGDYIHRARVVFPSGRITEQWGGPLRINQSPFV